MNCLTAPIDPYIWKIRIIFFNSNWKTCRTILYLFDNRIHYCSENYSFIYSDSVQSWRHGNCSEIMKMARSRRNKKMQTIKKKTVVCWKNVLLIIIYTTSISDFFDLEIFFLIFLCWERFAIFFVLNYFEWIKTEASFILNIF